MTTYEDGLTLAVARDRYFTENGFGRGYDERWVKLKAGPIPIWFPNTRGRVRAAKLHDLHHVATGYQTTWTGEAEIGAWEIASGCGRFVWAWLLNVGALAVGLVIAPRAVYRAFIRGRHSTNLYRRENELRDEILHQSVGDLRRSLQLDAAVPAPGAADVLAFSLWCVAAVAYAVYLPVLGFFLLG